MNRARSAMPRAALPRTHDWRRTAAAVASKHPRRCRLAWPRSAACGAKGRVAASGLRRAAHGLSGKACTLPTKAAPPFLTGLRLLQRDGGGLFLRALRELALRLALGEAMDLLLHLRAQLRPRGELCLGLRPSTGRRPGVRPLLPLPFELAPCLRNNTHGFVDPRVSDRRAAFGGGGCGSKRVRACSSASRSARASASRRAASSSSHLARSSRCTRAASAWRRASSLASARCSACREAALPGSRSSVLRRAGCSDLDLSANVTPCDAALPLARAVWTVDRAWPSEATEEAARARSSGLSRFTSCGALGSCAEAGAPRFATPAAPPGRLRPALAVPS